MLYIEPAYHIQISENVLIFLHQQNFEIITFSHKHRMYNSVENFLVIEFCNTGHNINENLQVFVC